MTKINESIKRATQKMVCAEHNKKALIKMQGDKIEFECCCDKFQKRISEAAKKAAKEAVTKQIKDAFKNIGKKR